MRAFDDNHIIYEGIRLVPAEVEAGSMQSQGGMQQVMLLLCWGGDGSCSTRALAGATMFGLIKHHHMPCPERMAGIY